MFKYGLTLSVICLIAAGLLAGVYSVTKPKILAQAKTEEQAALKEVLVQAERFEEVNSGNEVLYFKGFDAKGDFAGIAFRASAKGYSSTIEVAAGMNPDGSISAIKVISQNETPGLGSQVAGGEFSRQFRGLKNAADAQAITGATISSRAVIKAVAKKAEELKVIMKNGK